MPHLFFSIVQGRFKCQQNCSQAISSGFRLPIISRRRLGDWSVGFEVWRVMSAPWARGFRLQETKKARPIGLALRLVGLPGVEPGTNGLCVPATVFTAPFGFVVWTVSCLYGSPVQSLHLPLARLGSGLPRRNRGFPEFERFYQGTELTYPKATHSLSTMPKGVRY